MIDFQILLFDGFDDLDAIAPFEVLDNARAEGAALGARLVVCDGPRDVVTSHGVRIHVPERLDLAAVDWLLVPGGAWATRSPVGVWGEIQRGELPRVLADARARGAKLASVCTGAMLLSAAGLTRGRRVTTHHTAKAALAAEGAEVIDARVVDDGDLVTAGGVTSGLDLALWLVERLVGEPYRRSVETRMEYEMRRSISVR